MTLLNVRVTPGARSDSIAGWMGDPVSNPDEAVLKVRVQAPPERGKANDAVSALIARTLGLKARDVRIVRGETSRDKVVEIEGLSRAELLAKLGGKK